MKKINLTNFNLFHLIKIFIYILSLPIFFLNFINYDNSKIIYVFFSLVTIIFVHYSIKEKTSIYGLFICIFTYLGFWFKFSINNLFENKFIFRTGYFDFLSKSVDDVLIVCTLAILCLFIPCIFQNKIEKLFYVKKLEFNNLKNFYFKNKITIIFLIYTALGIVFVTNLNYHIYQKGHVSTSINQFVYYLYSWLLQFGFASFFSFIIYFEIDNKNKSFFIILAMIESFLSSISLLSRGLIFLHFYLFIAISKIINIFNKKNYKIFITLSIVSIILSITSVWIVKDLREKRYCEKTYVANEFCTSDNNKTIKEKGYQSLDQLINSPYNRLEQNYGFIFEIILNRFVGIDSVMAIYAKKNKSFNDYILSWKSRDLQIKGPSYFDKNYLNVYNNYQRNLENIYKLNPNLKYQFSPGFIAHSYMSGSLVFVCFICFLLSLIMVFIEIYLKKIISNKIFLSLIFFLISYRIIHFGYDPSNTYKFIIAINLNILFFILAEIFLKNYGKKK